jgi:hypothetical protein
MGIEAWMVADSEPARLRRGDPDAFDALRREGGESEEYGENGTLHVTER